ncbi:MAG TPA: ethylbenzene dehydrogenase-related protein [Candidatus Polarisedimenticolia bacterium]|nr:ethylbenzene dehydrogenase-related protein [Candidatus Polarisedimenticolia bacterium]
MRWKVIAAVLAVSAVVVVAWSRVTAEAPAPPPPATPDLLALGKQTYEKQCVACHGPEGRGDGEAAYLLFPKPRDFTLGKYALVSTWERVPTDRDLFATISRGMPGSAMPSWGHLPERTRWGLVQFVKSFAAQPWEVKPESGPVPEGATPSGPITVPTEPPYDDAAKARAREMFAEACAGCHGPTGRGDGAQQQFDDKGYPTRPRDLTLGVFKGDPSPQSLYRRVIAGMPGTPMPMSDWSYGQDAWHLVHFVRSLSSDAQRARVEMKRFTIDAPRVAQLPDHPDSSLWNQAVPVALHLMPLWWRAERPEELTVRALHDGKDLALLLVWTDSTYDHTAIRVQDFRDAVAAEFSLTADPPFFAMGARGDYVNIWMWKSERQADMEVAFQDLDKVYPNIGIDSYPNSMRSALEQPTRGALTLQSDPTYVTGWGAGNIVSDPTRASSAEDLRAQGFGTLQARPGAGSALSSKGVYAIDSYRVIFRRALGLDDPQAVRLQPGSTVPVAFAVWNGSAGDRDGKKSVTIWQELKLAP